MVNRRKYNENHNEKLKLKKNSPVRVFNVGIRKQKYYEKLICIKYQ